MREIGHFIGGKKVAGTSGRSGDVFNPNTGEVQAKVSFAKKSEVEQAIANAEAAQPAWASTNPQRRARVLFKFLELVHKEFDSLAQLLSSEHGKTVADSKGCGANMRVTPLGLMPGLTDATRAGASQLQAALTHGHSTALAASELTA